MEKAQHVKQFVSEVKDIIAKAAGADIVRYIPEHEIEHLYKIRCLLHMLLRYMPAVKAFLKLTRIYTFHPKANRPSQKRTQLKNIYS